MADTFQQQKDALTDRYMAGQLEPRDFWQLKDELEESRRESVRLDEMENKARQLESAIVQAKGVVLKNRKYGVIPNPWKPGETFSLTNQMALERNADYNLIAVLKHEAGMLPGDRRMEMAKKESERIEKQQRIIDQTAAYRESNNAKLNRQQPNSMFAEEAEKYRRAQVNNIPYFGA